MEKQIFENAVARNSRRLFLIALSFTKNHDDSEDIVQNVFMKLWNGKNDFENDEHIKNWLTAVCVNESKNCLKSYFRKNTTDLDSACDLYSFDRQSDLDLFTAVMKLPKTDRVVIHLFYYEELSIKQIADLLDVKETAVGTRLHRARSKLKEMLGDEWIHE